MCFVDALQRQQVFLLTVPINSFFKGKYSVTFLKSLGSPFLFVATVAELETLLLTKVNPFTLQSYVPAADLNVQFIFFFTQI